MPTDAPVLVFLDIYVGDEANFAASREAYERTRALLLANYEIYGLPATLEELSEEGQEILEDLNKDKSSPLLFTPPNPLCAGRLTFSLFPDPGLSKTRQNFIALCTGEKGACKSARNKRLHYLNTPIHRVVKGFVAQGGDVTRGDGSGGESIYGPKFPSEKAGLSLSVPLKRGSLCMASAAGRNANSSQFFFMLAQDGDESTFKKIRGKYVVFGEMVREDGQGESVLRRLEEIASHDGKGEVPTERVWIGGCGVIE